MSGKPVSLRIPDDVRAAIDDRVRRTGRTFSSVVNEMLSEAVKMQRIPGIRFRDEPSGRTARIEGTGIEVWEIIERYRAVGENWEKLKREEEWLTDEQLRAALAYAEAYPEEIEDRIGREERWTPERVWATYPHLRPRPRA